MTKVPCRARASGGFSMRALGFRSLAVTCERCHHEAVLWADDWSNPVPVHAFPHSHGLHALRHRRRGREAELARDARVRELAILAGVPT